MSDRLDKAIIFATEAHSGQTRKRENIPYILHPLEVASIVSEITKNEDVIIAAMLHDTVEDTYVDIGMIYDKFGKRVAELVEAETEDKREDLPPAQTWKIRKEESIEHLRNTRDTDIKILWLADKVSNLRSIYSVYLKKGDDVWSRFNMTDISEQKWYYTTILNLLDELDETLPYKEYQKLLEVLFKDH